MKSIFTLIGLLVLTGNLHAGMPSPSVNSNPVISHAFSVTPAIGDFGGIQAGTSGQMTFTITNTGDSALTVKKIEVLGNSYHLTDSHTYPFEVTGSLGNANPLGNSGMKLEFTVRFIPVDYGIQTGKIVVTLDGSGGEIREMPLTGECITCYRATEAHRGENHAPKKNAWFKYTADKFSIVEINSCHPNQTNTPSNQQPVVWFRAYEDCHGTIIPEIDEYMPTCPYDHQAIPVRTVMTAGQTIYMYWMADYPGSTCPANGFYFNINATYPTDGDVCENAIPLTLPVVDHFGNTRGFNDDYNMSPCSPFVNYIDGNDKVYSVTIEQEGYLKGSILGAYAGVHILDECPKVELEKSHCKGFAGGTQGGTFRKKISPGTYYVIVSNWTPPQSVDYLLNLSLENLSAVENQDLALHLTVFPNPAKDVFTVSLSLEAPADLSLELVSISGQSVYRRECRSEYYFQDDIDVSRVARGVYYLKINSGSELTVRKLVLE